MVDSIFSNVYNPDLLLPPFFTRSVVAILIFLIGFIIGRILGNITHKVLHEIELNRIIKRATGLKLDIEEFFSKIVSYIIYFLFAVWALDKLGLATTILTVISIFALALIVISILLAIKDFIPNVFSGIVIHSRRNIQKGDIIKTDGIKGEITRISLVETEIKTSTGDIIFIPNALLTKKKIIIRKIKKRKFN